MTLDRAIEILDPDHREHYDSFEPVNEACRMAIKALQWMQVAQTGGEWPAWTPVEDGIPDDGKEVLGAGVFKAREDGWAFSGIGVVYWDASSKMFCRTEEEFYDMVEVTHWMPLPPLP